MPMLCYGEQWRWIHMKQWGLPWGYSSGIQITLSILGHVWIYDQRYLKYAPEKPAVWRPWRDAWTQLNTRGWFGFIWGALVGLTIVKIFGWVMV